MNFEDVREELLSTTAGRKKDSSGESLFLPTLFFHSAFFHVHVVPSYASRRYQKMLVSWILLTTSLKKPTDHHAAEESQTSRKRCCELQDSPEVSRFA
ncbi:Protein of unknown function [Gryllus bimaculatus]|nr:Protein of unknown function [Gryllus bimaculatus]